MAATATRLSTGDVESYWRDGFLFPIDVFTPSEAANLRAELETVEHDWLDNGLPLPLNTYRRVNSHYVMPFAAKMAMSPTILDAVESILGPDLLIWSAEFFIKEANTTQYVSMHQDLTYWGLGATSDQMTAWVALSPATVESGCMDFVKASHQNPIMPHKDTFSGENLLSRGQEIAVDVADDEKTHIELQPGQMSLHHGLTIHGSGPNRSSDRRIGFAIRYVNPNARQQVADRDYAMLARGEDRTGNFILVDPPSGLFAPDDLERHARIRADQAKALAHGAKEGLSLYQGNDGVSAPPS